MRKLLEELFTCYYDDVYRYLYSLSKDPSLTEDLVSETFLEILKSIASFRGESDMKTWIFSIARHRWYRYLRRRRPTLSLEELPEQLASQAPSLDRRCYDRQVAQEILRLLEEVPERTRKILWMRMDGYSFYEIGKSCGITENSARVICFRVREKIRKKLREEGFDHE